MTPVQFEQALDRVLRGDQGAAQALIDHNKAVTRTARREVWNDVAQAIEDSMKPGATMPMREQLIDWCRAQATKET